MHDKDGGSDKGIVENPDRLINDLKASLERMFRERASTPYGKWIKGSPKSTAASTSTLGGWTVPPCYAKPAAAEAPGWISGPGVDIALETTDREISELRARLDRLARAPRYGEQ